MYSFFMISILFYLNYVILTIYLFWKLVFAQKFANSWIAQFNLWAQIAYLKE